MYQLKQNFWPTNTNNDNFKYSVCFDSIIYSYSILLLSNVRTHYNIVQYSICFKHFGYRIVIYGINEHSLLD